MKGSGIAASSSAVCKDSMAMVVLLGLFTTVHGQSGSGELVNYLN